MPTAPIDQHCGTCHWKTVDYYDEPCISCGISKAYDHWEEPFTERLIIKKEEKK